MGVSQICGKKRALADVHGPEMPASFDPSCAVAHSIAIGTVTPPRSVAAAAWPWDFLRKAPVGQYGPPPRRVLAHQTAESRLRGQYSGRAAPDACRHRSTIPAYAGTFILVTRHVAALHQSPPTSIKMCRASTDAYPVRNRRLSRSRPGCRRTSAGHGVLPLGVHLQLSLPWARHEPNIASVRQRG